MSTSISTLTAELHEARDDKDAAEDRLNAARSSLATVKQEVAAGDKGGSELSKASTHVEVCELREKHAEQQVKAAELALTRLQRKILTHELVQVAAAFVKDAVGKAATVTTERPDEKSITGPTLYISGEASSNFTDATVKGRVTVKAYNVLGDWTGKLPGNKKYLMRTVTSRGDVLGGEIRPGNNGDIIFTSLGVVPHLPVIRQGGELSTAVTFLIGGAAMERLPKQQGRVDVPVRMTLDEDGASIPNPNKPRSGIEVRKVKVTDSGETDGVRTTTVQVSVEGGLAQDEAGNRFVVHPGKVEQIIRATEGRSTPGAGRVVKAVATGGDGVLTIQSRTNYPQEEAA